MREATSRRYTRLLNEQAEMPDLIMIDGGIGQVNAVKGVLDALGLNIPIVGLAKRDEELYVPGNSTPLRLPERSDALRLLQRVRDETHRFATSRNQNLRTKENTVSLFTKLPHIGEKRAALITEKWPTMAELSAASVQEIADVLTLSTGPAEDVHKAAVLLAAQTAERRSVLSADTALAAAGTSGSGTAPAGADYAAQLAQLALKGGAQDDSSAAEKESSYASVPSAEPSGK